MPIRLEIIAETASDVLAHLGELANRMLNHAAGGEPAPVVTIDVGSGTVVHPEPEPSEVAQAAAKANKTRRNTKKPEADKQGDIEDALPPVIKVADLKPAKIAPSEFDTFDSTTRAQVAFDFEAQDLVIITDDNARKCRDAIQSLYDKHGDEPSRESLKVFRAVKVSQLRDAHADLFCRYVIGLRDHLTAQKK